MSAVDPRLEAEYNNRNKVPDHQVEIDGWCARAKALREQHRHTELDLSYASEPRQMVDVFWPSANRDAPLAVFLHGGYWQTCDRTWFSHLARGVNDRGIALAIPSYRLCPQVPLATIVDDMHAAIAFLMRRYERDLTVIGHSAGGHLTAMALATDWRTHGASHRLKGGVTISGLFDLRRLVPTTINGALGLDEAEAYRLSPLRLPKPSAPLVTYVGEREGAEFEWQSATMAEHWQGRFEHVAGANHFTAIEPLEDGQSTMVETIVVLANRH